jgi:cytochrome c biogenesis protein CcdA
MFGPKMPLPPVARRMAYRIMIGVALLDVAIGLAFILFGGSLFPPGQAWAAFVVGGTLIVFGLVPFLIARARFAEPRDGDGPGAPPGTLPGGPPGGQPPAKRPSEPVVRRR